MRGANLTTPRLAPGSTSQWDPTGMALPNQAGAHAWGQPDDAALGAWVDLAAGPYRDGGRLRRLVLGPRRGGSVLAGRGRGVRQAAPHAQLLLCGPFGIVLRAGRDGRLMHVSCSWCVCIAMVCRGYICANEEVQDALLARQHESVHHSAPTVGKAGPHADVATCCSSM